MCVCVCGVGGGGGGTNSLNANCHGNSFKTRGFKREVSAHFRQFC